MNKKQLISLLDELNLRPQKKYGQNFFINNNLLSQIIDNLEIDKSTNILEIGAGLGFLTEILVLRFNKVLAIEIDNHLYSYLSKTFICDNLKLINKDILNVSNEEIISELGEKIIVIANIPYNITTDIILKLLPLNFVAEMILLVQFDFAERLANNNLDTASKTIIKYYSDIEIVTKVDKSNFYPAPHIDSAILKLKKKPVTQDLDFELFIKKCFSQKRKLLIKNLSEYSNIEAVLKNLNISNMIRIEQLNLENILDIYQQIRIK